MFKYKLQFVPFDANKVAGLTDAQQAMLQTLMFVVTTAFKAMPEVKEVVIETEGSFVISASEEMYDKLLRLGSNVIVTKLS